MTTEAAHAGNGFSSFEQLRLAREIINNEANAVLALSKTIGDKFCRSIELLFHCKGSVIVSGMGKAGLIGQKIAATLASTGTRSHCLHPGEAIHGDLGRIHCDDIVLMLSQSGETEEIVRLLPLLAKLQVPVIAITGSSASTLGRCASATIELGEVKEAGSLGLAPSTSTTMMLALGDALALVVSRMRGFRPEDFARFHPGGSLGRKLSNVEDVMRPIQQCRVADDSMTIREVLVQVGHVGRRTGAIVLTGKNGTVSGIFTDSDLARLFESRRDDALDGPICNVMITSPKTVHVGDKLMDAVEIIVQHQISELPVLNDEGHPVGLLDITDVIGILPQDKESTHPTESSPIHSTVAGSFNVIRP